MNSSLSELLIEATRSFVAAAPIILAIGAMVGWLMGRFVRMMRRATYDADRREAMHSELRESYEHRIAGLSREMVATKDRWEDANHLLISGQRHQPEQASLKAVDPTAFLKSFGLNPDEITVRERRVFVLTPFSQEEKAVFDLIKDVCQNAGFTVVRGDETRAEGDILQQVIQGIVSSRIIIANISSRNPNVFFELGIAMALGKPTLLISDTMEEVPFDVRARRIVLYHDLSDLKEKLATAMLRTVSSLLRSRE